MNSDAVAKFSARNAVDVMCTKPARFPKATFDVCGKLTFDGAVTANNNDAKLQHGTGCRGQAGGLGIDNCEPNVR